MPAWPDGVIAALAEAVVAYRLVVAVNPALAVGRAGWAFFLILLAYFAGLTAASLAHSNSEARFSRRLLAFWLIPGLIAGFLVFLVVNRIGFGAMVTCIFAWFLCSGRGIAFLTKPRSSQTVRRDLVLGTMSLGFLSLVARDGSRWIVLDVIIFTLLLSVLLMLSRRREVSNCSSLEESTPWLTGGAVFIGLALIAVLVLYALGPGGAQVIFGIFGVLWKCFTTILTYLMMPLAYLIQWMIMGLQRLWAGRKTEAPDFLVPEVDERIKEYLDERELTHLPEWVKWPVFLIVLFFTGYLVWRYISKYFRTRVRQRPGETRTSLARGEAPREWLNEAVGGLAALVSGVAARLQSLFHREPRTLEDLYNSTLMLLAARGLPKDPPLTPYEYRDLANDGIPTEEGREALNQITAIFAECFYGGKRPQEDELALAKTAYKTIRGMQ